MMQRGETIFEQFLTNKSLISDRNVLDLSYVPGNLPHRDKEINEIASILVTGLKGGKPSNMLIFGKTGNGKTAVLKYIGNEISRTRDKDLAQLNFIYINCQMVDTHYSVLAQISNHFSSNEKIPFTGWPIEKVFATMRGVVDSAGGVTIVVLDEIDKLVCKSGDDLLYDLVKINDDLKNSCITFVGITNDTTFTQFLDPRVKSRLGAEEMVFPPYNADQLVDILRQRAEMAFVPDVLDNGVIPLCAALAAQEHGDARMALNLLRIAGEIAERSGAERVKEQFVYKAKNKIEMDVQMEMVKTLPTQSKILLLSIVMTTEMGNKIITTGNLYELYRDICRNCGITKLTQRRVADFISELDMLGILNARMKSFGRGGRTREISLNMPIDETKKTLLEDEVLKSIHQRRQSHLI